MTTGLPSHANLGSCLSQNNANSYRAAEEGSEEKISDAFSQKPTPYQSTLSVQTVIGTITTPNGFSIMSQPDPLSSVPVWLATLLCTVGG